MNEQSTRSGYSRITKVPIEQALDGAPPSWREFLRLPKVGARCPVTGLSRATLNELILGTNPPVRSVVLRKRGTTRGIRLIDVQSLLAHLHGLETSNNVIEKDGGK